MRLRDPEASLVSPHPPPQKKEGGKKKKTPYPMRLCVRNTNKLFGMRARSGPAVNHSGLRAISIPPLQLNHTPITESAAKID